MNNRDLLEQIQKYLDYRLDDLREDLKGVTVKLDEHSERLSTVEREQQWVHRGLIGVITTLVTLSIAFIKKLLNW